MFLLIKFDKILQNIQQVLTMSCFVSSPGSAIAFNSSSSFVKPLVSSNLTLTCKLQDTQPTGPAIGKRSVRRNTHVVKNVDGDAMREGEIDLL